MFDRGHRGERRGSVALCSGSLGSPWVDQIAEVLRESARGRCFGSYDFQFGRDLDEISK